MKLEFAHDEIGEYLNGGFHFKNDGKSFDVPEGAAGDLLNAKHSLRDEFVNVFRPASDQGKVTDIIAVESSYPDNFPSAEALVKAGYTHSDILLLNREQLIDIKGIGAKAADSILEFTQE